MIVGVAFMNEFIFKLQTKINASFHRQQKDKKRTNEDGETDKVNYTFCLQSIDFLSMKLKKKKILK